MTIDHFFNREYDGGKYNCAHFVAEVWQSLTGVDIRGQLDGFLLPPGKRFVKSGIRRRFIRLEKPKDLCIVLMYRVKGSTHIGVFIRGRVLHIQRVGVSFHPVEIATMGYKTFRFYDVKNDHTCGKPPCP